MRSDGFDVVAIDKRNGNIFVALENVSNREAQAYIRQFVHVYDFVGPFKHPGGRKFVANNKREIFFA